MSLRTGLGAAFALTRPAQWPILTGQLLVGMLLVSPRAVGGGCWFNPWSGLVLVAVWAAWVPLLNGGTLAFNSAYDRDTGPVAYLARPPAPPSWLAGAALGAMCGGVLLALLVVGPALALVVAVCVVLSVLYSHPVVRLKGRPGLDLLINMIGYGGATTLAGLLGGRAAHLPGLPAACPTGFGTAAWAHRPDWPVAAGSATAQLAAALRDGGGPVVVAFALLFGSFYPLTQLYQLDDDRRRGDRTLAGVLGRRGSLGLALVLAVLAAGALALACRARGGGWWWLLPAAALAAWLAHLANWLRRCRSYAAADHERGMYRALALWAGVDAALLVAWLN